jgi:hypothetical protein
VEPVTMANSDTSGLSPGFKTPVKSIKVENEENEENGMYYVDSDSFNIFSPELTKTDIISVPKMRPRQSSLERYKNLEVIKIKSEPFKIRRRSTKIKFYNSNFSPMVTSLALGFTEDCSINEEKDLENEITHKQKIIESLKTKLAQFSTENDNLHSHLLLLSIIKIE